MQLHDTSIGGYAGKNFDERGGMLRRGDLERAVKPVWEANGLPLRRPWHELTKADLEKMAETLGVLGNVTTEHKIKTASVAPSLEDVDAMRDEKRQEILAMKHFAYLAMAKKYNVPVPDTSTPEQKAAVVEEILDRMENA
jgi:hypothetical protein